MLTDIEVAALQEQVYLAHNPSKTELDKRNEHLNPSLATLILDTWDVIEFLRAQMDADARPEDGVDDTDTMREEHARVSDGGKPKSKPPMNLEALDASDIEMAALISWAEYCGIPYQGQVLRVGGRPRGVLYGDMRPAWSAARNMADLIEAGWVPPEGMLEDLQAVRFANLRRWPELDHKLQGDRSSGLDSEELFPELVV